jgi:hypothetical protein
LNTNRRAAASRAAVAGDYVIEPPTSGHGNLVFGTVVSAIMVVAGLVLVAFR